MFLEDERTAGVDSFNSCCFGVCGFCRSHLGERFDFVGRACFPAKMMASSPLNLPWPWDVSLSVNYVSEVLIVLKTVLIAEATLLTPLTHTSAIKATNKAYSTRS